ncbi:unnamed protein product [Effrenium voratum]|nr:unnamed protein product [Effrenium voratum]
MPRSRAEAVPAGVEEAPGRAEAVPAPAGALAPNRAEAEPAPAGPGARRRAEAVPAPAGVETPNRAEAEPAPAGRHARSRAEAAPASGLVSRSKAKAAPAPAGACAPSGAEAEPAPAGPGARSRAEAVPAPAGFETPNRAEAEPAPAGRHARSRAEAAPASGLASRSKAKAAPVPAGALAPSGAEAVPVPAGAVPRSRAEAEPAPAGLGAQCRAEAAPAPAGVETPNRAEAEPTPAGRHARSRAEAAPTSGSASRSRTKAAPFPAASGAEAVPVPAGAVPRSRAEAEPAPAGLGAQSRAEAVLAPAGMEPPNRAEVEPAPAGLNARSRAEEDCLEDLVDVVAAAVTQCERQLFSQRLKAWKARMAADEGQQRAWVKRFALTRAQESRAARPAPSSKGVSASAVHPSIAVDEQQREWTAVWGQESGRGTGEEFQSFLRNVPNNVNEAVAFSAKGSDLLQAMRAMTRKAPGPDDWRAKDLLRMGPIWWSCLEDLWAHVISSGCIPRRWVEAKIVLIPKDAGGWRPLALTSVLWRAGSRALLKTLKPWLSSWAGDHLFGGLAGRGVEDCLIRINHAVAQRAKHGVFVRQDIHRFFDAIQVQQAIAVLSHLKAPPALVRLIDQFYLRGSRVFTSGAYHGSQWCKAGRGILQGCPLSPMIAAAVMLPWTCAVQQPGLGCAVFVDDRVLWAQNVSQAPLLQLAMRKSEEFDSVFGLRCRPEKCGIAALSSDVAQNFGLSNLPYAFDHKLTFLGLQFDLNEPMATQLVKFDMQLVLFRITAIARVAASWKARLRLLQCLVNPTFTWAAGLAALTPDVLKSIRSAVVSSFGATLPPDVPWGILFELLGWEVEPLFASAAAHFRAAVRHRSSLKQCWEDAPLDFVFGKWFQQLPCAAAAANDLGWWASPDGALLHRRDQHGQQRTFELGVDNFACVLRWLKERSRRDSLKASARVFRGFRRQANADQPLAQGLTLPPPAPGVPCYQGHRQCFKQATDKRDLFLACLATGCSWWHFHPGFRRQPHGDAARQCACGKHTPSRPHLVWTCPATASAREGVPLPSNRAEERLFTKVLPEQPAAPRDPRPLAFEQLVHAFRTRLEEQPSHFFVATDGSEIDEVAAFAIATPGCPTFVSAVTGEDQTAYRAEVEAGVLALQAAADAARLCAGAASRVSFVFVLDCQAAIKTLKGGGSCKLLARRAFDAFQRLCALTLSVELFWVPSHGKVSGEWAPHPVASEAMLRGLNEDADEAARWKARLLLRGSARQEWARAKLAATQWEVKAVNAVAGAASIARGWWASDA